MLMVVVVGEDDAVGVDGDGGDGCSGTAEREKKYIARTNA